jgi:uncharacterized membrane protein
MTLEEKRAWIQMVVSVVAYAIYAVVVVGRADGRPLTEVPYVAALLVTIVAGIVAAIVIEIASGVFTPRASLRTDERDRQIGRRGEQIGHSFVVIGAVAAMLMAMAGWNGFWIANTIYLCFVLSTVLASIAKIGMYRGGLPQW